MTMKVNLSIELVEKAKNATRLTHNHANAITAALDLFSGTSLLKKLMLDDMDYFETDVMPHSTKRNQYVVTVRFNDDFDGERFVRITAH